MIVCIPLGWITYSYPITTNVNYAKLLGADIDFQISNRVDLNRSMCINRAKQKEDDLLMLDADVIIGNTPTELKKILRTYKREVVVGITMNDNGILVKPPPPPDKEKYEVEWASLSFVYIPRRVLQKLKPIDYYGGITPMYMTFTSHTSEDVDFITRLRKMKIHVIADKRIHILHFKMMPLQYQEIHFEVNTKGQ